MKEFLELLIPSIMPVITGLCSGIVSYKMAVKQSSLELQKAQTQYTLELQKVREQNELELKRIREQSQVELRKSQNELEKIRLESDRELKKIQLELDKQAEIYSKNAETDAMNAFLGQFMTQFFTNPQGMEEQIKALEKLGNMGKRIQGK